ncbi:spore coat U domain-containing protein [Sphingomonas sp. MG17]|uniref:Spore coat U domain-containing protein n=1 Tax=Sphingomonas tagetis TaxID=2949092 RepID=A0A9X2HIH7_9SPHN|nr:spore coat protein U domain-containing protein [Sphingomonas tagetis]MCP3729546.1 spore coat U domain-containing protein [Sphingomonas tagetis]
MVARLLIGTLALAAALPAAAQSPDVARGRLELAGQTPAVCLIKTARAGSAQNASFTSTGERSGEVRIAELVDPQTAQPRAAEIVIELPVVCNAAHRLTLTSANGGLLRDGGNARNRQAQGAFGELLGYQLDANWGSRVLTLNAGTASVATLDVPDGTAGDLSLRLSIPAGGGPLVAGRYSDTVVIELNVSS